VSETPDRLVVSRLAAVVWLVIGSALASLIRRTAP
jgi:hypothetical protein